MSGFLSQQNPEMVMPIMQLQHWNKKLNIMKSKFIMKSFWTIHYEHELKHSECSIHSELQHKRRFWCRFGSETKKFPQHITNSNKIQSVSLSQCYHKGRNVKLDSDDKLLQDEDPNRHARFRFSFRRNFNLRKKKYPAVCAWSWWWASRFSFHYSPLYFIVTVAAANSILTKKRA